MKSIAIELSEEPLALNRRRRRSHRHNGFPTNEERSVHSKETEFVFVAVNIY